MTGAILAGITISLTACGPSQVYRDGRGFYSEEFSPGLVRTAAKAGRVNAICYDLTGARKERLYDMLVADWKRLVDEEKITKDKVKQFAKDQLKEQAKQFVQEKVVDAANRFWQ